MSSSLDSLLIEYLQPLFHPQPFSSPHLQLFHHQFHRVLSHTLCFSFRLSSLFVWLALYQALFIDRLIYPLRLNFTSLKRQEVRPLADLITIAIKSSDMEHDDFYQHLPFSLTPDQLNPAFVALGTGLQECLLAAHHSKLGSSPGLVIDIAKTYGSTLKTVTLKELHQLNTHQTKQGLTDFLTPSESVASNAKFMEWCLANKRFRGFSIDIEPRFFLANSSACECLKQADMDKYMDFHLVSTLLFPHQDKLKPVPLSKGRIFESGELSLLEKKLLLNSLHRLAKLYHTWKDMEEDQNSTRQFDKDFGAVDEQLYKEFQEKQKDSFVPFIQKMVKNNTKLVDFLSYVICHYPFNYNQPPNYAREQYSLGGFLERFGKFITSCGLYGESPFLYVDNGIGDIPQAFSRIASIYGSTYVLHPKIIISAIVKCPQGYQIHTNLSPGAPIVTPKLYIGPTQQHLQPGAHQTNHMRSLRVILIAERTGEEPQCPGLCCIPSFKKTNHPVFVFMVDQATQSCPSEFIVYQMETVLGNDSSPQKLAASLREYLGTLVGSDLDKRVKYHCVYVRKFVFSSSKEQNLVLKDAWSVDLDQHFQHFMDVVGLKENYFRKEETQQEENEPFGGYDTNYLIEKLENIDLKPIVQIKEEENKQQAEENPTGASDTSGISRNE